MGAMAARRSKVFELVPDLTERVLYFVLELTNGLPVGHGRGTDESAIAERLAMDLASHVPVGEVRKETARDAIQGALEELAQEQLITLHKVGGPWKAAPTLSGRRLVQQWEQHFKHQERSRQVFYVCCFVVPIGISTLMANATGLLPSAISGVGTAVFGVILGPVTGVISILSIALGLFDRVVGTKTGEAAERAHPRP